MATVMKEREKPRKETGLLPWRPFESFFPEVFDEMERLFNFPSMRTRPFLVGRRGDWIPTVDMYEKEDYLYIHLDLPGLRKREVEVALEDGVLVIKGERKVESEVKEEDYYRAERSKGEFYRGVSLPFEVKAKDIKANFEDGVLMIQIPKPAEAKAESQKIAIH